MTDDRKVVEFETVHRRFTEAVETITQLYTLLEGLRRAEAQKEQTVATMSNASERLSETSETIASYCVLLRSALDATLKALASAEELASGADMNTIRSELVTNRAALTHLVEHEDSLDSALANLDARQRSISRTVDVIHNRIEGDLSQTRESRDSAQSELATVKERLDKLETSIARLPPKIRRKYTLDDL